MSQLRSYSIESVASYLGIALKYAKSEPETAANAEKLAAEYWSEYERATWGRGA